MFSNSVGNPLNGYQASGKKTKGAYDYFVFLNTKGEAVVLRYKSDESENKFCKTTAGDALTRLVADTLDGLAYVWFHELN